MREQKEKAVINRFHRLLRGGQDYNVDYMYDEAGKKAFLTRRGAREIINKYYRGIVTDKMKAFVDGLEGTSHSETFDLFAKEFNVCKRESILLIRYIKRAK